MKKEAQKKLLAAISEVADAMVKDKVCWHGKEAVESAIMDLLSDKVKRDHYHGTLDLDLADYLPTDNPIKEGRHGKKKA